MAEETDFTPGWFSAPGETIADILAAKKISQLEFAHRLGISMGDVQKLLTGALELSPSTAGLLEEVIGSSAEFWMSREAQFRQDFARVANHPTDDTSFKWLEEIPVSDMAKFGWMPRASTRAEKLAASLRFFNLPDVSTWRAQYGGILKAVAFRASPTFELRPGSVAAWLRRGEIEAEWLSCGPWNRKAFRESLPKLRSLTWRKEPKRFLPELQERCAEFGVAVVVLRAPAGCPASGATKFVSQTKALLLLSFRHLSDDHFWFSFFHEAGHLVLHDRRALFLDGTDMMGTQEEEEANRFASDVLVPKEFRNGLQAVPIRMNDIIRFALRVGIAPGVIVGQLQHQGRIRRNQMNFLKRRFSWGSDNSMITHENE